MLRRILHLDIDASLASIEQLRDPALIGRPVVVGSGVVASRSYEAKALGIHTGMVLSAALARCPGLAVREGDSRLAERYRQQVADVVRRFAPLVEVCSLDDLYADFSGVVLDPVEGAVPRCRAIRAAVREATGLSVSQGVGSSRTVARLATTRAKPAGILEVAHGAEREFLGAFPVRDLPGIGPRTAQWLETVGIHTVQELWSVDRSLLRQAFGARGEEIWLRSRGDDARPVAPSTVAQSISRETSFDPQLDEQGQQVSFLQAMLAYLVDRAAAELRNQGLASRTVRVRLRHVDGNQQESSRTVAEATDHTNVLCELAFALLGRLLEERRVLVRLVGVTLASLEPRGLAQGSLFADEERRNRRLFAAVDSVRERHGFGRLVLGSAARLLGELPHGRNGFRLRTPSLTK